VHIFNRMYHCCICLLETSLRMAVLRPKLVGGPLWSDKSLLICSCQVTWCIITLLHEMRKNILKIQINRNSLLKYSGNTVPNNNNNIIIIIIINSLNLPQHLLSQVYKLVMLNSCSIVRKFLSDEVHLHDEV
jgi:hypothetical protein